MRDLGDYSQRIAACSTLDEVGDLFGAEVARHGYVSSMCRLVSSTGGESLRPLFRNWPESWRKLSDARGFGACSPILHRARQSLVPFTWEEVARCRLTADEHRVLSTTYEWGWIDGFVVPAHGPDGYFAYVGMASRERDLDLGVERRTHLQLAALVAHARCHALRDTAPPGERPFGLSARELECLRWVAAGKSDWEIGMILKVSASTVRFHVDGARLRLGARTRPQAVAILAVRGLL
jgi:LuxR family quorum sensing-dependent transcriptional regulator